MAQVLFFYLHFANTKMVFDLVVRKLMLVLGLLLSCSGPARESEILYVAISVRKKFLKRL